jgi:type IV secretion system protein VirB2
VSKSNRVRQRPSHWLRPAAAYAAIALLLGVHAACAATGGGPGLPWESPLTTLTDSIKGPVAFAISLLGIVVCCGMLIWGGEISEFVRRMVMLVLVIAGLVFAANLMSTLFGTGAIVV